MGHRILIGLGVLVLIAGVALWLIEREDTRVPALTRPASREVDARDVAAYVDMEATTYRLRTTIDVLPGGFSAAMAPVIVDWSESEVGENGHLLVRNINHGGNPLSGITVLRSAQVYPAKLRSVEFVMVPLGGPKAFSHGQLRFVFDEGGIELIGNDAEVTGENDGFDDLVLSWEAWRPPGVDFNVIHGLSSDSFKLSLRAYSGAQRFLEDTLSERDWTSYSLQLPGGKRGYIELLYVALTLGDGAGRHAIGQMLDGAADEWASQGPDAGGGESAYEQWRVLRDRAVDDAPNLSDPRIDMEGKTGYQTLLRSCATMALYSVNVATQRLIERGEPHEGMRPTEDPHITQEPQWMADMATSNIAGIFARAPRSVRFIRANPTSIPSKIPGALDDAGLLVRGGDGPVSQRFSLDSGTPWGPSGSLLIR